MVETILIVANNGLPLSAGAGENEREVPLVEHLLFRRAVRDS
jgi:hypothetical protein